MIRKNPPTEPVEGKDSKNRKSYIINRKYILSPQFKVCPQINFPNLRVVA